MEKLNESMAQFVLVTVLAIVMTISIQFTSATQIFYPGIYIEFHCNVGNPFLQVEGVNRTEERGFNGYIEDLRAMGIEAKDVDTSQSLFIQTVCINGSSPELAANTTTINITCQEIRLDPNFIRPPQTIPHFTLTLTYYQNSPYHLPPPKYVHMSLNDNNPNMLEWSRPPCVNESSTSTYNISVSHTLEFNYTIHITSVSNRTTINITVSTTSYDLSLASDLVPCFTYHIQVSANNIGTTLVGERSNPPILYTTPGQCSTSSSKRTTSTTEQPSTTSPAATSTLETSTAGHRCVVPVVITGVACSLVFCVSGFMCGMLSVIVYNHIMKRNKNKNNSEVSTQPPPPVYEDVSLPSFSVEMKENVAYGPLTKTK